VLPLLIVVVGLMAYPLVIGFRLSFDDKLIGLPARFVGMRNYTDLLGDPSFRNAVICSFLYRHFNCWQTDSWDAMALALNEAFRGRNLIRGMLLIPWVIPVL
jgi:multiple sugar transport system permease protein